MSRSLAAEILPAGKAHCLSVPRPCGSRAPRVARLPATFERFVLKITVSTRRISDRRRRRDTSGLYSKEHGNGAHEVQCRESALFSARRGEEDPRLRELLRKTKGAPSTPTFPGGSPDSDHFPPGTPPLPSPRGANSKPTKARERHHWEFDKSGP